MSEKFSLASLLRIRRAQEEHATAQLVRARHRAQELAAKRIQAQAALAGTDVSPATPAQLFAVAAQRSASAHQLADLADLESLSVREVEQAAEQLRAAAQARSALEKLEERHAARVEKERDRAEQLVLDEFASRVSEEATS